MTDGTTRTEPDLASFLIEYLGVWPPDDAVTVVGSDVRTRPGWDGAVRDVVGVRTPEAGVLSVPPGEVEAVRAGVRSWEHVTTDLPARVPRWLHPFGGQVLVTLIDNVYAAGVGIKRHNAAGLELSVGTEEAHRGRGLATRLVAQAARWVLAQGAVPIYLHDPANIASDRTATAAGFPDLGWQILGLWSPGQRPG